jgi:hypothetical protein
VATALIGFAIGLPHNGFQALFGGFAINERDQSSWVVLP